MNQNVSGLKHVLILTLDKILLIPSVRYLTYDIITVAFSSIIDVAGFFGTMLQFLLLLWHAIAICF